MRKIIVLFIIAVLYSSCNRIDKRVVYDNQGNFVSSLWMSGKDTVSKIKFIDQTLNIDLNNKYIHFGDTLYENNKGGNIFLKIVPLERSYAYFELYTSEGDKQNSGYIKNNLKINTWNYYKNNKLEYTNNYIVSANSSYLSEIIVYNDNGSINEEKSDYFDWRLPDTLIIGKSIGDLKFKSKWSDHVENYVCIGYNINEDFTNLLRVEIDTFPYPTKDNMFKGFVAIRFDQLGKQKIKGFVYETRFNESEENVLLIETSHRYFEKEFFIISRPDSIPTDKVINYNDFKL